MKMPRHSTDLYLTVLTLQGGDGGAEAESSAGGSGAQEEAGPKKDSRGRGAEKEVSPNNIIHAQGFN